MITQVAKAGGSPVAATATPSAAVKAVKGRKAMTPAEKAIRKAAYLAEGKTGHFTRLADVRVNNALDKIRLIGNLGGAGYESTPAQVDFIEGALHAAVQDAVNSMRKVRIAKATFTLPKS